MRLNKEICGKCTACQILWITLLVIFINLTIIYIFWLDVLITIINHLPGTVHLNDTNRDIHELITSRGFKQECHYVKTANGAILHLERIINPYIVANRSSLRPVYLQHGFQTDGTIWLISRDGFLTNKGRYSEIIDDKVIMDNWQGYVGSSLGFVLASRNYDVWIGNYRGSIYSINHTHYDASDSRFWQFSMDEMINEDLPSIIDYIIKQTNFSSIGYVGHSQGNMMMFSLLSEQPHYSNYIRPFIAISPVFYMSDVKVPLFKFLPFGITHKIQRAFPRFVMNNRNLNKLHSNLCENILFKQSCFWLLYGMFGSTVESTSWDRIGVYWRHVMTGSSSWNFAHWIQILSNGGQPEHFDYGNNDVNFKKYGSIKPPIYNASNINSEHIALIYSSIDFYNSERDVQKLKDNLKVELLDDYQVPEESRFNHVDLVWSPRSGEFVHKRIVDILSRYNNN